MELLKTQVELKEKKEEVKVYHSKTDSLTKNLSKEQLANQLLHKQAEQERLEQQKRYIIFGFIRKVRVGY